MEPLLSAGDETDRTAAIWTEGLWSGENFFQKKKKKVIINRVKVEAAAARRRTPPHAAALPAMMTAVPH